MIKDTHDGAIVDWLEEIPLEEFESEYVRMVIGNFREGHMPVTEAIALLREDCDDLLTEYVQGNKEIQQICAEFD